jgi:hypothetical protein
MLQAGMLVRKIGGQISPYCIGQVTEIWISPMGKECAWIKYPEWSVAVLELTEYLEPIAQKGEGNHDAVGFSRTIAAPQQLSLF